MGRGFRRGARKCASLVLVCALLSPAAYAWGPNGHRLVVNKAVDTLPEDMRGFFETNRGYLAQHATDPLDWLARNPAERRNQYIQLDKYGRFPFDAVPRNYDAALRKHTKRVLEANGLLPWQIGVYSKRLEEAFRQRNWEQARLNAAILAHYVAQAHDPFNTTENFDGRLSGQPNVNLRFGTGLLDRYSRLFFVRPNDAVVIDDPTGHAFEICLSAHSWLENILLADRRARAGLSDYTDEYYDRFYNQAGAVLVRQLSDAASNVGSYWLTAWENAGRPQLPR